MEIARSGEEGDLWWWVFPRLLGFRENVRPFIPRLRYFSFFLLEVEITSRTLSPLGRVFPDELRVSSFPDRFPHYAWTAAYSAHSSLGQRCRHVLGVTCHLHFWQNDQGLLRATDVTQR